MQSQNLKKKKKQSKDLTFPVESKKVTVIFFRLAKKTNEYVEHVYKYLLVLFIIFTHTNKSTIDQENKETHLRILRNKSRPRFGTHFR